MITVQDVELRAGARLLLSDVTFRVQPGDRIGLVGRNGAGKTTLTKTLAKQTLPAAGSITHSAPVGYLPQDPRTGDLDVLARDRVLSARGLDEIMRKLEKSQVELGERPDDAELLERYGRLEERFTALGSDATTLLLDEPTNHLDADSITWLRGFLQKHAGGLIVISHDVELLDAVVNKVFHLDANRAALDQYNVGWKTYLQQRETDEKRRKRERLNAEKQAGVLNAQAEKMRAKATKAKAAQGMFKRAEKLLAGVEGERAQDRVAKLRFPEPAPCGKTPLTAAGLSKSYGSLEIFTDVDLAIDRGARVVVLGLNGAGKTTLLRVLSGTELPDTGEVLPGHGLRLGYYAQEHDTLDTDRTVLENMRTSSPDLAEPEARRVLGSFLFSGDVVHQKAGTLSGGEKTRLALATLVVSGANVLLLDEPTNNLDPASREEVLSALAGYQGAVVLVTHDEGAVVALQPEKVLLLPDGVEDQWSDDFADLVALA
jgi:ATPase subunit of ABC transporter with duplicated ATPase domains